MSELPIDERTLAKLAAPFFVVDLPRLEAKYTRFNKAFSSRFPRSRVALSYKTNHLGPMLQHLHGMGAWAEVVSGPEYEYALGLGVPAERVVYNGPGKSPEELARALADGAVINLDSLEEAHYVAHWRKSSGGTARGVGIRINLLLPDREPGTQSRFGVELDQLEEVAQTLRDASVSVDGIHAHLTSRRRRVEYYEVVADAVADAVDIVGRSTLTYLDLGGGYAYLPREMRLDVTFPTFEEYAEVIDDTLRPRVDALDELTLLTEPGIALSGDCLTYYAPVLATKKIGGRSLAIIEASVHSLKPTRHPAHLPTRVLDSLGAQKSGPTETYDVVGYTCLEDDVIAEAQELPQLLVGDRLAIGNVGAYTFVFKPPFIRPLPAFYLWNGRNVSLARDAQTPEEAFGHHAS